jgi:hypothetical protein
MLQQKAHKHKSIRLYEKLEYGSVVWPPMVILTVLFVPVPGATLHLMTVVLCQTGEVHGFPPTITLLDPKSTN